VAVVILVVLLVQLPALRRARLLLLLAQPRVRQRVPPLDLLQLGVQLSGHNVAELVGQAQQLAYRRTSVL
jgi:hypothetical protein